MDRSACCPFSTPLNTCGISSGMLFMQEYPKLADLSQMLVEEWDTIPHQCVTKLETSMRRRCLAVVAVYLHAAEVPVG